MSYYELDNIDAADFLFLTLKKTFNNHPKLAHSTQQSLLNFINFYPRLYKLRHQYQPQKAEKLLEDLENAYIMPPVKVWFWNKLNEIEAKAKSSSKIRMVK